MSNSRGDGTTSTIIIKNRFDFISLQSSGLVAELEITQDGRIERSWPLELPHCPPQSSVPLQLPNGIRLVCPSKLDCNMSVGDASDPMLRMNEPERLLTIRFSNLAGSIQAWDQFQVHTFEGNTESNIIPRTILAKSIAVDELVDCIRVKSGRLSIEVNRVNGMLQSMQYDGIERFVSPMRPNFWRPPTDNDFGWASPKLQGMWKKAGQCADTGGSSYLIEAPAVERFNEYVEVWIRMRLFPQPDTTQLDICYSVTLADEVIVKSTFQPGKDNTLTFGSFVTLLNISTGRHLDVEGEVVRARWNDKGEFQRFILHDAEGTNGEVSLVAHTGCFLEAASSSHLASRVQLATEYGPRAANIAQKFRLERSEKNISLAESTIFHGDTIFLKSGDGENAVVAESNGNVLLLPIDKALEKKESLWIIEKASASIPPPRIGFLMALDNGDLVPTGKKRSSRIQWFGRGPHETYIDRKAGAEVKLWDGAVSDQTFRYCRPQENGNKTETRWAAIGDDDMHEGLLISMYSIDPTLKARPLNVAAHHFLLDDFDAPATCKSEQFPKHGSSAELKLRDKLCTVCVDTVHQGVGGINSWGSRPLPQHMCPMESFTWAFRLLPFGLGDPSPSLLART